MKNGKFEKKDLKELTEFYEENGPMTCSEFRGMIDDIIENSGGGQESVEFWNIVQESLSNVGSLFIYDVKDEDDKLKVKTMINALIEIKDAEVISLPYGLFDTLERCYVADTVDVASRTIRKIKRYI